MKRFVLFIALALGLSACTVIIDVPDVVAPQGVASTFCGNTYSFTFKTNAGIRNYQAILVPVGQAGTIGNAASNKSFTVDNAGQRSFAGAINAPSSVQSQAIIVTPKYDLYVKTLGVDSTTTSGYVKSSTPVNTCG